MIILFCRFGGLGEHAIIRALKRQNHQVVEFQEKAENYDYDKQYMNHFIEKMQQVDCDAVFSKYIYIRMRCALIRGCYMRLCTFLNKMTGLE